MNIIPQNSPVLAPDWIRYAVHIWQGETQIGATTPTTDQAEARQTLNKMRNAFPDSVLVVQNNYYDDEWDPVSDEMLNRLAAYRTSVVLAELIAKGPANVNWTLRAFSPNELSGHVFKRAGVEEFAAFLEVDVVEEKSDDHTTVRAAGRYLGVSVEVYCVIRAQQVEAVSA
ncbi:hypothetical protein AB0L05_27965 [Nonomuraea pusilla]|uniref:hypothetical protein n=1 Tax=Nonomuraea pusilla TaxID=46177 RepID=UPI003320EF9F